MTRHLILTGAGCLAVGLAAGWHLRPSPDSTTQETTREASHARVAEAFASHENWVMRRDASTDTHQVRTEDHGGVTRYHPSGAVAEVVAPSRIVTETGTQARGVESGAGILSASGASVAETVAERIVIRTVTVTAPAPDWLVGPAVGFGPAGTMYGAMGAWRFAGPFHAAGSVLANGDAMVGSLGLLVSW